MVVFEFVSLTCLGPSEADGDEVYITFNGVKVFPGEDQRWRAFRSGSVIVNEQAGLDKTALSALLSGKDAVPLGDIVGSDALRRAEVPPTGLMIQVREYDALSKDDVLGTVLVSDRAEQTLQKRRLEGDGGSYVLSYLVRPAFD